MNLVSEIEEILYCYTGVSNDARDKVLKKTIESYKQSSSRNGGGRNYSVLERVVGRKTTFEKEVSKQGKQFPYELEQIFGTDINLGYKSELLDKTIKRLYWN